MTPAERRRVVVLAGHQGDVDTARRALRDDDAAVRAAALGALERIGGLDDRALATALTDVDPTVRRRAAELAARRPDVSLLDALTDGDDRVVEMAAFACGEREQARPEVVARLSALADDHPDALVREAAVAALGAIGADAGLPAILHAATHDKPAVRRRAVIALAPFDGPEVDTALAQALEDRDWQVRQVAEDLQAP
jgi:HEAT repeat protein